jgi:transcriptional regulator of met regulon
MAQMRDLDVLPFAGDYKKRSQVQQIVLTIPNKTRSRLGRYNRPRRVAQIT